MGSPGGDGGCSRELESGGRGGTRPGGVSAPRDRRVTGRVTKAGVCNEGWGW